MNADLFGTSCGPVCERDVKQPDLRCRRPLRAGFFLLNLPRHARTGIGRMPGEVFGQKSKRQKLPSRAFGRNSNPLRFNDLATAPGPE